MNILLLCGNLSYAGAQRQMFELAKGLNRKHKIIVCSIRSDTFMLNDFLKNDIQVEILNLRARNFIRILLRLNRLIKKNNIKIMYSFLGTANTYNRLIKLIIPYLKIIVSERNSNNKKSVYHSFFEKSFAKITDLYIANSFAGQLDLRKRFNIDNSIVIQNGVDINRFVNLPEKSIINNDLKNYIIISMIARIKPQKNYEMFLDVADAVCDKYQKVVFWIIGDQPNSKDAYKNSILNIHNKLKNKKRILFIGIRSDIPTVLSDTNISILTSHREGCSNTVLESMFSKCPLVLTDVGDNKIMVSDENKPYIVEPGDVEGMVNKISELIESEKLRELIGSANYIKASNNFTVDKMVDKTERIMHDLLDDIK